MKVPSIEQTTLGALIAYGITNADGDPIYVGDASKRMWVIWPRTPEEAENTLFSAYETEADALFARDRIEDEA